MRILYELFLLSILVIEKKDDYLCRFTIHASRWLQNSKNFPSSMFHNFSSNEMLHETIIILKKEKYSYHFMESSNSISNIQKQKKKKFL